MDFDYNPHRQPYTAGFFGGFKLMGKIKITKFTFSRWIGFRFPDLQGLYIPGG